MQNWSQRRLIASLAVATLVVMEAVSFITAPLPPCIVDAAAYAASAPGGECPIFHVFLLKHAGDGLAILRDPYWVIAIFAAVLGVSTLIWWRSMRKLVRATADAALAAKASAEALLVAEQAQLVAVFDAGNIPQLLSELGRAGRADRGDAAQSPPQDRVIVSFVCKNYGKTPALIKAISREMQHRKELPSHLRYTPIPNLPKERTVVAGAMSEPILCGLIAPVTAGEASSIRAGESFLWLWGHVVYDDAFGREHEHRFLTRYRVGYGFQPYQYEDYNRNR